LYLGASIQLLSMLAAHLITTRSIVNPDRVIARPKDTMNQRGARRK
jgi:hypothetical protein